MRPITIRLPENVVAAYDAADGNRSALMRRRLAEAVENGEVDGVPSDLQTLAERDAEVDRGRLARKRSTFKQRMHDYFAEQWTDGGVTTADAERLAETWRAEAALYGEEEVAFADAVLDYWRREFDALDRPDFPSAGHFVALAEPEHVDMSDALIASVREARVDRGLSREATVEQLRAFHNTDMIEFAVEQVYGGEQ